MDAEKYLREKARLSQALNGEQRLQCFVTDFTKLLENYTLDASPGIALDATVLALESMHLGRFNLMVQEQKKSEEMITDPTSVIRQAVRKAIDGIAE